MNSLPERLQMAMDRLGISQEKLAERADTTQVTISNILNGKTKNPRNGLQIATALGVTPEWLLSGKGEMVPQSRQIESNIGEVGGFDLWDRNTPLNDEEIAVPFFKDIGFAAGHGAFDDMQDYNGFRLRFSKATLRRCGVQYDNAVCVTASGDSMEPVLPDGTTIGIDLGNKNIRDGKMYGINHGGLLRVKILSRLPNDFVSIRSYNSEEYPEEKVHLSEIEIIGRVFWWSVLD